jgi:tetratricopeptide (TPR) repeat protein
MLPWILSKRRTGCPPFFLFANQPATDALPEMTKGEGRTALASRVSGILDALQNPQALAGLLVLLTIGLFWPAIHCDFVEYDDGVYVFENPQVLKGITGEGMAYAFRSIHGGSWMPLTWISHMLDVMIFGVKPAGHHFTNIFLHALGAGLLLLALNRLTRRLWLSALVAVVFAWHPLRTESVVWVAERKDVLSTLLFILGLLAYARYAEKPGRARYAWVVVCLMLGLMAKPMLVTFPFVLLLLDLWPLRRLGANWPELRANFWPRLREKIPLLLLVLLISGMTFWSQHRVGAVDRREMSLAHRARQITSNYAFYFQKTFLTTQRTVIYPVAPLSPIGAGGVGIALLGLSVLALWRMFVVPWLALGWFWFLGTLVPVIGFVPVGLSAVADRYSYIPSIGLGLIIVWGLATVAGASLWRRRALVVLGLMAVLACAWATRLDIRRWRNSESLFESASLTAPHKIALNNLAYALVKRGEYSRAIEFCTRAIELDPQYGSSYGNRALAYAWSNDYEQAKRDYDQAVKLGARPIQPMRRQQLLSGGAIDEATSSDPEEAWHLFAGVSGLEPKSAASFRGRGDMRLKVGDVTGGISDYTKAIGLSEEAVTYTSRGNAYVRLGDWSRALADLTKAVELAPNDAKNYQNRAVAYFKTANYESAWADVERCRKLGGTPPPSFLEALSAASGRKP